jgi:hypothetical protein
MDMDTNLIALRRKDLVMTETTQRIYSNLDKLSNLIERMDLAHKTFDQENFRAFKEEAAKLCFDTMRDMEKAGFDGD